MKYLLFILLILFCSCYSGSSKKGQKDKRDSICLQKELYALHKYVDSIIKTDTILQQRFHCFGAGLTKDKISIDWRTNSKGDFGYKISTRYCCITCKKELFFHANSLFLLNFAQKRNKIIQQWTLENLFERLKATIIRNDFLRTIIIIGLIALACLIIYTVGKCTGKFFATI